MSWTKHDDYCYFRSDMAYAGKDHTKDNKTFICYPPTGCDGKDRFSSIKKAMEYVDRKWPLHIAT